MSNHTPGPWTTSGGWQQTLKGSNGKPIATMTMCGTDQHYAQANANLIAAAPELQEACEEFVRKCDCGEARSKRSYAQMTAAINKARGVTDV